MRSLTVNKPKVLTRPTSAENKRDQLRRFFVGKAANAASPSIQREPCFLRGLFQTRARPERAVFDIIENLPRDVRPRSLFDALQPRR